MKKIGHVLDEKCRAMAERAKKETHVKPCLNQVSKPSLKETHVKPCLNQVSLPKTEFHRVAKQLTNWGVTNSGAVIKRENPLLVKQAVDITLASLNLAQNPKAYFRGVLRNLQKTA